MPVTPIIPGERDEGMGASASPSGHSRAEPFGLGASPECPSRIHPWTLERIMTAFWDVSNAVGRMDAREGSRVADSRLVTADACLVVGSLRTLLVQVPKLLEAVRVSDEHPTGEDAQRAAESRSDASAVGEAETPEATPSLPLPNPPKGQDETPCPMTVEEAREELAAVDLAFEGLEETDRARRIGHWIGFAAEETTRATAAEADRTRLEAENAFLREVQEAVVARWREAALMAVNGDVRRLQRLLDASQKRIVGSSLPLDPSPQGEGGGE